jgi:hypothetical protein
MILLTGVFADQQHKTDVTVDFPIAKLLVLCTDDGEIRSLTVQREITVASPRQQWLLKRATMLRHTYTSSIFFIVTTALDTGNCSAPGRPF